MAGPSNIRVIFGMKLRALRNERKLSLQRFSNMLGLSPSYLNEIENGKKYPKVEKIIQIAQVLGVPYDELVSQKLDREHNYLERFLHSPAMQKFPFHLFGITVHDLVSLVPEAPREGNALVRALVDTARAYDMRVDTFLHTALRCYQEINENYFEDVEDAVKQFRAAHGWTREQPITCELLYEILRREHDFIIDEETLAETDHLKALRSVWLAGPPRKLLINRQFSPVQKAFVAGRELGYQWMKLKVRGHCSPDIEVESFEQVLNAFKASYFASALFMDGERLRDDLRRFFNLQEWDPQAFLTLIDSYGVTHEMFFYRLCEILPKFFGIKRLHFLRIDKDAGRGSFSLVKQLNMSQVRIPTGLDLHEHFCRRWLSIRIIGELERQPASTEAVAQVQRSRFIDGKQDYFCICVARRLVLSEGETSSMTIGFQMDNAFKRTVKFWNDPKVPEELIGETCERCPLTSAECIERAAPQTVFDIERRLQLQREELHKLLGAEN